MCGIAPFGEYLCLLAYIEEEENGRKVPQPPELRIITRHNEEVSSDALTYVSRATPLAHNNLQHSITFFHLIAFAFRNVMQT